MINSIINIEGTFGNQIYLFFFKEHKNGMLKTPQSVANALFTCMFRLYCFHALICAGVCKCSTMYVDLGASSYNAHVSVKHNNVAVHLFLMKNNTNMTEDKNEYMNIVVRSFTILWYVSN